jgi:hypothetical protein
LKVFFYHKKAGSLQDTMKLVALIFVCSKDVLGFNPGLSLRRNLPSLSKESEQRSFVRSRWAKTMTSSPSASNGGADEGGADASTISLDDDRLYVVELPASTGIQWGSDLSLSWVRVLGFEDASPAPLSGVEVGHQLVAVEGDCVVGMALADCVQKFGNVCRASGSEAPVAVAFFKGSSAELKEVVNAAMNKNAASPSASSAAAAAAAAASSLLEGEEESKEGRTSSSSSLRAGKKECVVTVEFAPGAAKLGVGIAKGKLKAGSSSSSSGSGSSSRNTGTCSSSNSVQLTCEPGTNLRDLLVENGINVYRR